MLPDSVKKIVIHTGNIINSKELKKKAMQSPSEEVCDSVSGAFHLWLKSFDPNSCTESDLVFCENPPIGKGEKSERADLKISVKIFLEQYCCDDLKNSIIKVLEVLDITMIDSLILSLPAFSSDKHFDLKAVKPLWVELEQFVRDEKIVTIGLSDLDTDELSELYDWTQVKPSVNQVNLESCCVMPTEMIAFAKENDIQLLTHNDPKVLLPNEMLLKILEPGVKDPSKWKTNWIVRYSVVVKCRGIIQNKGYIMSVERT